jgi:hypothetical protein
MSSIPRLERRGSRGGAGSLDRRLLEEGKKEHVVTKDIETSVLANVIMGMHHGILLEWYMKQDKIDGV